MLHVRQGNQVLGTHPGGHAQPAVGGQRHVENPGGVVEPVAVRHDLAGRIDHRDFRFRRRAVLPRERIDVGAVHLGAIGREGQVTRAAARHQALDLLARGEIHHGNVVADAISHVEIPLGAIHDHRVRLEPAWAGCGPPPATRCRSRKPFAPGVGDVEPPGVRRERQVLRHAAHVDAARDGARAVVVDHHLVGAFAHHEKAVAIRRNGHFDRRWIAPRAQTRRLRSKPAPERSQGQQRQIPRNIISPRPSATRSGRNVLHHLMDAARPRDGDLSALVAAPNPKCKRQSSWLK